MEGKSWEEIVKFKIFMPLSMHETFTDIPAALSSSKNVSIPHYIENGKVIPTEWDECGIYSPADGIFCNVIDLAKFAKFMLNNGKIDNTTTIISSEVLNKMHSPQTIVANMFKEYFNPKANLIALGFGWFVSDYKGNHSNSNGWLVIRDYQFIDNHSVKENRNCYSDKYRWCFRFLGTHKLQDF